MHTVRIIYQRILLLVLTAMGLACTTLHAQAQKRSARDEAYVQELVQWLNTQTPINTPDAWRGIWDSLTVECECTPAVSFEQLHAFTSPTTFKVPRSMNEVAGAWLGAGYVVFAADFLTDRRVIKHELLHVMLGPVNFTVGDMHPDIFKKLRLDKEWLNLAS